MSEDYSRYASSLREAKGMIKRCKRVYVYSGVLDSYVKTAKTEVYWAMKNWDKDYDIDDMVRSTFEGQDHIVYIG